MKIEAMTGYPVSLRVMRPPKDHNITKLQGHIFVLTDNIQELTLPRAARPHVWCIGYYTEGHTTIKFPILMGSVPPTHPMMPPPIGPSRGVLQVATTVPFHKPV